jgi:predicted esterase
MSLKKKIALALAALVLFASGAEAQARPSLALVRVMYNTLKTTSQPQGELKDKIDALDQALAQASLSGRTGEIRHLLTKGIVLLTQREWTDTFEYSTSLVVRAEEVYVDPARPWTVRLEQTYVPAVSLAGSLTVQAALYKSNGPGLAGVQAGDKVKDLAARDGVSRDLQDDPCRLDLDLSGVEDGTYVVRIEVREKDRALGSASLAVDVRKGLRDRLAALEAGLKDVQGFDALRAEVLYPADHIRCANRGLIDMGTFKAEDELRSAEQTLAALKAGRDPFAGRTGDLKRHYLLEGAGEIMPYRLYVPSKYDGQTPLPLVIALHGLGATENSLFEAYNQEFPKLAEEHGFLLAAPLGYRVDGAYGRALFAAGEDAALRRRSEFSEKDVLSVLALMKRDYKVDESRIYLTGHSMGAIGTWFLGAKYPEIWAALAPFAGLGDPATVARMKDIPEIVVHGDADPTVPVAGSRIMVAELAKQGVDYKYIEVPGGNHMNVVAPNAAAVFDFFAARRKKGK